MTMIRNLRLKLQKRFGYLKVADSNSLLPELARFLAFIDSEPLLSSATLEISSAYPNIPKEIQAALSAGQSAQGLGITGSTHLENATIGLLASRNVLAGDHSRLPFLSYTGFQRKSLTEAGQLFVETYVRPYYEELDERIDSGDTVLGELVRAKHLIEWFRREEFYGSYIGDTQRGEKRLGLKLYEVLFERGLEFSIEPTSASGEADMVASQQSKAPLVADVKVFDPERSKNSSYIQKGLRQVHIYTEDYNAPMGYLVIFTPTSKRLIVDLPAESGIQCWQLNGKTVFLLQIDIFPHEKSATQRPAPQVETITADQLTSNE